MHRIIVAGLALALAGCGRGEEDFAVTVKRPLPAVFAALEGARLPHEVGVILPELKVEQSRPGEHELLYTVPGDGSFPATIRFRLEDGDGGRPTVVHTAVDVPPIQLKWQGGSMVISERKVENAVRSALEATASDLANGSNGSTATSELQTILFAIAAGTNAKLMAQVSKDGGPERLIEQRLGRLGGDFWNDRSASIAAGMPQRPRGDPARPALDPDADLRRNERAEQNALRDAARPMDDARGGSSNPSGY